MIIQWQARERKPKANSENLKPNTYNYQEMRQLIIILTTVMLSSFAACEKDNSNNEVENYVMQLRMGQYDSNAFELPNFSANDIPALLKYRNDRQEITGFPINPISSMICHKCTLGMYVLWTIEGIRVKDVSKKRAIGGFPSHLPVVVRVENKKTDFIKQTDELQKIVADAYYNWWNSSKNFDKLKEINPFKNTSYSWM